MYKVLIVDDEYELRKGISNYFPWGDIGFEVVGEAENGRDALKFLLNNTVDVILCDIKMPVMSGLELVEILSEQQKHIKIVLLSAYKEFDYAKRAIEYGVKDYIVKPTKYKELLNVFTKIRNELDQEFIQEVENAPTRSTDHIDMYYHDKMIRQIKDITRSNFQNVTLQYVADEVNMSASYLSKYFKTKSGENFSDYVLKVKMEKAKDLLIDIKYRTYEVSERVGYSNPKNFARAFKKYYGKSPREFRNGGEHEEF